MQGNKLKLVLLLLGLFLGQQVNQVGAVAVTEVDTTVKISVCGDGVAENPEECDGSDFIGSPTCLSQGFAEGTLSCDLGCELDTSNCSGVAPTPTPTSSTGLGSSSDSDSDSEDTADDDSTTAVVTETVTATTTVADIVEQIVDALQAVGIELPAPVAALDSNGDSRIEPAEMRDVVSRWVNNWRQFVTVSLAETAPELVLEQFVIDDDEQRRQVITACDVNTDQQCDLVDLSIILYYVGK